MIASLSPLCRCVLGAVLLSFASSTLFGAKLGLAREAYGVWDRSGGNSVEEYPFTRGQEWGTYWADVHPGRHTYNWTGLDTILQLAFEQNQKAFIKVQPVNGAGGPPEWIYEDQGGEVPRVTGDVFDYGFYLDPEFQIYFREMVQAMADHVRNEVPPHLQELIAFVRVDTGATGDEEPYENAGDIDRPDLYAISPTQWRNYRLWVFEVYRQAFQEGPGPKIPLLFLDIEPNKDEEEWEWVTENVKAGFGAKLAGQVRGHHWLGSNNITTAYKPYIVDSDFGLFTRNEMDQTWKFPFFQQNIRLNMYWTAVEQLQPGMSVWDVTESCLRNTYIDDYTFAFEFFNTWAAELDPATARGGFSILHEGLDASDTAKFPVAEFGTANRNNEERYAAVVDAYADRGAEMEDLYAATRGQVYARKNQDGYNDAGWEIVPGNYERFLTQLDAGGTSIGVFRINGPLTAASHPYDRFGRRSDHAAGKDTMYFDLHDNLLPSRRQKVELSVTFLDQGTDQFELRYDADGNNAKTALVVTKTATSTWKTASVLLSDWAFANRGPNGADFMLVNIDAGDDIYHKVELVKQAAVTLGTVGKGSVSGRTDGTVYNTLVGTFAEGQRLELTVQPEPGWAFANWSGDLSGTNPRPFLFATEDTRLTAHFKPIAAEDDFEANQWNGGSGWTGAGWSQSGDATLSSAGMGTTVLLRSNGQIGRELSEALFDASLSFKAEMDSLEPGETVSAEVFDGIWHEVWLGTDASNGSDDNSQPDALVSHLLDLSALGGITQIRFTLNAGGSAGRFWIDDVQLSGTNSSRAGGLPMFLSDPLERGPAVAGEAYAGSVAALAFDSEGDALSFSILSGPAWLSMAADGSLSGTPSVGDVGLNQWVVEVSDGGAVPDEAHLLLTVEPNGSSALDYTAWSRLYRLDQGPEGDDDADDAANLFEFAVGGSPLNASDRGHQPTLEWMSGVGGPWMAYSHVQRSDPISGLSYQLELTHDLDWSAPLPGGFTVVDSELLDDAYELITHRIDAPLDPSVFIRLIVEEN